MKKIILVFVSVLTIGLFSTSCNKDDDDSVSEPSIVGKWINSKIGGGTNVNSLSYLDWAGNEPDCNKEYWQFKDNGTFDIVSYQSLPTPCYESKTTKTYVKTNNDINLGGENATITSLTDTELKIQSVSSGYYTVYVFTRG